MTTNLISRPMISRRAVKAPLAALARDTAHIVFSVDNQPYACPINRVQRLLRLADAVVKPGSVEAPDWETGLLKGPDGDIPIVSVRSLWGLLPLEDRIGVDRQALLVVEVAGQRSALLVDACLRVVPSLPPEPSRFRLSSQIKGNRGRAFQTAIPWENSLLVVLELNDLVPNPTRNEGGSEPFAPLSHES